MVIVEITRKPGYGAGISEKGPIRRLIVRGHAGYASRGKDIVCAAASVTVYNAAGGLEKLCGAPGDIAIERDGYYEINVPVFEENDTAYRADIIMEVAYIGFKQIESLYPDFLRVSEGNIY